MTFEKYLNEADKKNIALKEARANTIKARELFARKLEATIKAETKKFPEISVRRKEYSDIPPERSNYLTVEVTFQKLHMSLFGRKNVGNEHNIWLHVEAFGEKMKITHSESEPNYLGDGEFEYERKTLFDSGEISDAVKYIAECYSNWRA